jgi:hypothetical protein
MPLSSCRCPVPGCCDNFLYEKLQGRAFGTPRPSLSPRRDRGRRGSAEGRCVKRGGDDTVKGARCGRVPPLRSGQTLDCDLPRRTPWHLSGWTGQTRSRASNHSMHLNCSYINLM